MKKTLVISCIGLFLFACNPNPNKEERIKKLEAEIELANQKIIELEQKIEELHRQ